MKAVVDLVKQEKHWHKKHCKCEGTMKGTNISGLPIRCPVVSFQDMGFEDWVELLRDSGVEVKVPKAWQ